MLAGQIRDYVHRRPLGSVFSIHWIGSAPAGFRIWLARWTSSRIPACARGCPRLPQALIAGKPVVSYDVDGAREVVLDGETGFLLRPQSIGPLADRLCQLADDAAALRDRMGRRGRELFADVFRHEHMTSQLRALYERILASRAAP